MPFVALGFANRGPDAARSTRHFGIRISSKQPRKDNLNLRSRLFDAIVRHCPTAACKRKNSKALALTGAALFSTAPLNFQRPHSSLSAKEDAFFCTLDLTRAIYHRERTPFSSR